MARAEPGEAVTPAVEYGLFPPGHEHTASLYGKGMEDASFYGLLLNHSSE